MPMINTFLIDPTARTVLPCILTDANDTKACRHAIGCKFIATVPVEDSHSLVIDDEGLVRGVPYVKFGDTLVPGKAILLRIGEDGAFDKATMSISEVLERVEFLTFDEAVVIEPRILKFL